LARSKPCPTWGRQPAPDVCTSASKSAVCTGDHVCRASCSFWPDNGLATAEKHGADSVCARLCRAVLNIKTNLHACQPSETGAASTLGRRCGRQPVRQLQKLACPSPARPSRGSCTVAHLSPHTCAAHAGSTTDHGSHTGLIGSCKHACFCCSPCPGSSGYMLVAARPALRREHGAGNRKPWRTA